MAFLGGIGKALGLGSTRDAVTLGATALGASTGSASLLGLGAGALSTVLSSGRGPGGVDGPDVATAPASAGVDSAATLSNVSQTSQFQRPANVINASFSPSPMIAPPLTPRRSVIPAKGVAGVVGGVVGAVGGGILDFFVDEFGNEKKLVITRKLQRDIKKLFMLSGGSFEATAELYMMATGRQLSEDQIVQIYTKTFKNNGPYVTKAAVRKTRSTIRKLDTLCNLKDSMMPAKRRAPVRRRASSTNITQVK